MTPHSLLAPARLAGVPLLRSQSDERLIDLVRAGNDAAFEAIVARYRRPLLRHCARMLSAERAEDVIQQAFLRALRAMRADERPLDLRPWLYTIAHNAALNALRDRTVPSDTLEEEIDGVERPEQAFEHREGLREVVAAVGALPERQRDALVLRELEGRSYEEIAVKLGVSDGAVRQLLNRARNTLRAGVTAVTPYGLLAGIPAGAETPLVGRIAELTAAGAGAGASAVKLTATALVTGAVVGGVAAVPEEDAALDPLVPRPRWETLASRLARSATRRTRPPSLPVAPGGVHQVRIGRGPAVGTTSAPATTGAAGGEAGTTSADVTTGRAPEQTAMSDVGTARAPGPVTHQAPAKTATRAAPGQVKGQARATALGRQRLGLLGLGRRRLALLGLARQRLGLLGLRF